MSKEKIAEIIYEELSYMYCDNCRYATELTEDPNTDASPCDDCHRKYNGWGISMNEATRIANIIDTTTEDYERAIEQTEHDALYESTYNPEDGSI